MPILSLWGTREKLLDARVVPEIRNAVAINMWHKLNQEEGRIEVILEKYKPFVNTLCVTNDRKWVEETLADAIKTQNIQQFKTLFAKLSIDHLQNIANGEEFDINFPKFDVPQIFTKTSIQNLSEYLTGSDISVAVAVKTNAEHRVITTQSLKQDSVLAMHSVGKIFTGMMLMMAIRNGLIEETELDNSPRLDPKVIAKLPKPVQQRLKEITLKELMWHTSGLGDYLEAYEQAIDAATKNQEKAPIIHSAHDFLIYAEDRVYPKGQYRYSNLALVLLGLVIENACLEKGNNQSYESLLRENIIIPANLTSFASVKPEGGVYNKTDPNSQYIVGSPAGGYWINIEDLQQFGSWIVAQCQTDPELKRLIQTYGNEFYNAEMHAVSHSGGITEASAYLRVFFETQTIIAILSDQPMVASDLMSLMMRQSLLDNQKKGVSLFGSQTQSKADGNLHAPEFFAQ